jgi:hypothetical protein
MKLRNPFAGPINFKQPWVLAGLGCPTVFLLLRWIDFKGWWDFFHLVGLGAALIGIFLIIFEKKIRKVDSSWPLWMGNFFLQWCFSAFIISQIARIR